MGEVNPTILIILSALAGGSLTSCIARAKGRSFKGWGIYGVLLPFLALPHIIIAKSKPTNSRLQTVGKLIIATHSRVQAVGDFIVFWSHKILRVITARARGLNPLILFASYCAVFYLLARYMDMVTYTEELFPNTDGTLVVAIFLFVMGVITMTIARDKGRGHIGWFAYGTLLPPIPLLFALMIEPKPFASVRYIDGVEKCGNCAEIVQSNAEFCQNCGTGVIRPSTRRP